MSNSTPSAAAAAASVNDACLTAVQQSSDSNNYCQDQCRMKNRQVPLSSIGKQRAVTLMKQADHYGIPL